MIENDSFSRVQGTSFTPEWFDRVSINTPAAERRAATLTTRRTVKKDWQAAWLARAITCIDLTTLAGDDTAGRVQRLCAKARAPLRPEDMAALVEHYAARSAADARRRAAAGG